MAADAARKGKLLKELAHAVLVLALVWINFRICALEVSRGQHAGCAMAGPSHKDRVEIIFFDQPIKVNVDEAQARTRAPVAQQPLLDMVPCQRLAQQWV